MPELDYYIRAFNNKYVESGLTYGWPSSTKDYDYGHWNKMVLKGSKHYIIDNTILPFIKKHPEVEMMWNLIQPKIGRRKLLRVYVNGYTYGTDAYLHRDDTWIAEKYNALSETIIVYLNDDWNPDWAGETVIMDNNDDIEKSVLPKRNRVLIFDGNKLHAARPLSRACTELRKVLVFKTVDYRTNSKEIDFIQKSYSDDARLFYVSFKMAMALEEMKQDADVCLAGLYHAVYDKGLGEREMIRGLIGERAEQLVYDYHNKVNMESKELLYVEFVRLLRNNKDGSNTQRINDVYSQIQQLEKPGAT